MVCTYLIKSTKDGSFYTGISADPYKRLNVHNSGGLRITASRRPYELVYYKVHSSYTEARKHEKWLKKKNITYKRELADVAQLAPPITGGVK